MSWYIQKYLDRDFAWLIPIIIILIVYDLFAVAFVKRKCPNLNNKYYQLIIQFGVIRINIFKLLAACLAIFFLSNSLSPNYKPFLFELGLMCYFFVITQMLYDAFLRKQSYSIYQIKEGQSRLRNDEIQKEFKLWISKYRSWVRRKIIPWCPFKIEVLL